MVIYRKVNSHLQTFYNMLSRKIASSDIHVILKDFNINAQADQPELADIMNDYTQIVPGPTHLAGAILDHVYVKNSILSMYCINCYVKCIHFSDHNAIKFSLSTTPR
ncbi:uncharacterized protein LOC130657262 [Hydractinia symbiolongicarpus]|uniref:uncharacterized protein LOC130657262 n=1 Tax=Hydractinia symbiolongicarpus TaxID=13093 RepID=UPI00255010F0|nr:uncharacterized protein LOC130657262 [Hydractinia symbiolongicarpus]